MNSFPRAGNQNPDFKFVETGLMSIVAKIITIFLT
jgi:hypothetical protein